jgi:hypothetical protein
VRKERGSRELEKSEGAMKIRKIFGLKTECDGKVGLESSRLALKLTCRIPGLCELLLLTKFSSSVLLCLKLELFNLFDFTVLVRCLRPLFETLTGETDGEFCRTCKGVDLKVSYEGLAFSSLVCVSLAAREGGKCIRSVSNSVRLGYVDLSFPSGECALFRIEGCGLCFLV